MWILFSMVIDTVLYDCDRNITVDCKVSKQLGKVKIMWRTEVSFSEKGIYAYLSLLAEHMGACEWDFYPVAIKRTNKQNRL